MNFDDDIYNTYDFNTWCVIKDDDDNTIVFIGTFDQCVDFANTDNDRYFVDIWN